MFTIFRLVAGFIAIAFVVCTVRDMKTRHDNNESNIFQAASFGSVASSVIGSVKNIAASKTGGGGGFYSGRSGNYNGSNNGGDNSTSTTATGTSGSTIIEAICESYPDQCK